MFCKNCGNQLPEGTALCPGCGTKAESQQTEVKQEQGAGGADGTRAGSSTKPAKSSGGFFRSLLFRYIVIAAAVFIIVAIVNGSREDKYIKIVKEGTLNAYPQKTVGEAFDDFIADEKWESGESEDGDRLVNVKGKVTYMDKEVDIVVQFFVNEKDETFEYNACELNGIPQDNLTFFGFLEAVYGE